MGETRVRYTPFSNLQLVLAAVAAAGGVAVLHYINAVGDGGALFHLVISSSFAVVVWSCLQLAALGARVTPEGFVLRELYTEATVPFGMVLTVTGQNGLSLLLRGGQRVRVPGFEGSLWGEMRGYPAAYRRAHGVLQEALDRAREQDGQEDPGAEVTRVIRKIRLQIWVLPALTAFFFVFAQVNLRL